MGVSTLIWNLRTSRLNSSVSSLVKTSRLVTLTGWLVNLKERGEEGGPKAGSAGQDLPVRALVLTAGCRTAKRRTGKCREAGRRLTA